MLLNNADFGYSFKARNAVEHLQANHCMMWLHLSFCAVLFGGIVSVRLELVPENALD